jgi:small GTP-binding protein
MEKLKAVAKEFMGGGDEEKENSTFGNIFCNAFLAKDEQERRYASLKVKTLEEDPATIPGEEDKTSETDSLQLKNAIFRSLLQLQAIVDAKAPKLIDGLEGNASMLITDALQALNEAILVVIVGEFNSGKSSVINALLNEQVVPVGVVPTTNEVSLIKFGQNSRMEQQEDGTFLKTIPSDMLKSMTIVDTPGTNVVLERQQKLTEDFIPKADLVLFTLSADRPLTESETKFMTFIKQWSKKLVFVVNKKELLSESEISEVCSFVKTNSSQILGLKDPPIYPVSAKLELGGSSSGEDSGFSSLLKQIRESTNGVGTGAKLKFTTALSLGQSLSNALKQQITVKEKALRKEAAVVESVSKQMKQFKREMAKDANVQYVKINKAVDSVSDATEELTDTVLSLSNVKGITSYLLGSEKVTVKPSAEILTNFESALRGSIADHKGWLLENCNQQCSYYNTFLQEKIRSLSQSDNLVSSMEVSETQVNMDLSDFMRSASSAQAEAEKAILSMSSEVLTEAYETSVTEAATTSFGTAGVALVATLVATLILNSFTEDLLALVCGSVVAYLSVLSIPLQRAKVKLIFRSKLQEEIKSLVEALKKDLETALEETDKRVAAMAVPVEEMILMEKQDVEKLKEEQSEMDSLFEDLELKVSALRE